MLAFVVSDKDDSNEEIMLFFNNLACFFNCETTFFFV